MDKGNNTIKPLSSLPSALRKAIDTIKQAILESQLRATKYANGVELSLYYGIGHYISDNSRDGYWGKGALHQISEQLHKELPGLRGFSETNMRYMRIFYEFSFITKTLKTLCASVKDQVLCRCRVKPCERLCLSPPSPGQRQILLRRMMTLTQRKPPLVPRLKTNLTLVAVVLKDCLIMSPSDYNFMKFYELLFGR